MWLKVIKRPLCISYIRSYTAINKGLPLVGFSVKQWHSAGMHVHKHGMANCHTTNQNQADYHQPSATS